MRKRVFYIFLEMIIISFMFVIFVPTDVLATGDLSTESIWGQGRNFIEQGESQNRVDAGKIANILRPLAGFLLAVGTVVIIIVTGIMGIKYMTASPEERGKLKGQLVGLAVAAVVLFGSYGIWSVAYRIMSDLTTT